MPELPEVETTKEGIKPHLEGQTISQIVVRNAQFRQSIPPNIDELCAGKRIHSLSRRAKYILIHLSQGYILIHLGMSGHLRIVPQNTPPQKHDHVDLIMYNGCSLRFTDPRRFGLFLYLEDNPHQHSLFSQLGPEPLSDQFNSTYLQQRIKNRNQPIKSLIMNNEIVVGVGNIYATESLFLAGIHPLTPAKKLSLLHCKLLTEHIKQVLKLAIKAGGTTLKDFYSFDGNPGHFRISLKVYGRKKESCFNCNKIIESVVIGGRQSAYCPQCQNLIN
ncbi:MAG TPA: bifunctional DNA-formamidopyrimidine glycosylase/DNA-(apurinic or apyrimidinic site) lyase [Legionella sp.]|nr:bifunctional DNA-formamidopyrimidine glycosylase/DNA-(apurinic or apyrimidinic site) lyase [Legionella sp.]